MAEVTARMLLLNKLQSYEPSNFVMVDPETGEIILRSMKIVEALEGIYNDALTANYAAGVRYGAKRMLADIVEAIREANGAELADQLERVFGQYTEVQEPAT